MLEANEIVAKEIRTLTYDMLRNLKTSQLNVTAVFLVDTDSEPKINAQILEDSKFVQGYKNLIKKNLPSIKIFAFEGSIVELVKN